MTISDIFNKIQRYADNISGRFDINDVLDYTNDFVKQMRRDHKLPWTKVQTPFYVYPDVIEYQVPNDFDDLIKPQKNYPANDDTYFKYTTQPELARNTGQWNKIATDFRGNTKFLAIRYPSTGKITTIDNFSTVGSWVRTGSSATVSLDTANYILGTGSIALKLNDTTDVGIENAAYPALDMTDLQFNGTFFCWLYIPALPLTSLTVYWGQSSGNAWQKTSTTQYNGAPFQVGWNMIGMPWERVLSFVGSPTTGAVDYFRLFLDNPQVGTYKFNGFQFKTFEQLNLPYYSIYNFTSAAGVNKEFATAQDDIVLGEIEYLSMAEQYVLMQIAKYQVKDADLAGLAKTDYDMAYLKLRAQYPDLTPRIQTNYYDVSGTRTPDFPSGIVIN